MGPTDTYTVKKAAVAEVAPRPSNEVLGQKAFELGLNPAMLDHPMMPVLVAALSQAMYGKGQRHGGASKPWLEQPIFHYAEMHGRGFVTGQAAKKLEEAASTRDGEPFVTEVLGAIVYSCAAVIYEKAQTAERLAKV
jgi:hypothetical protein